LLVKLSLLPQPPLLICLRSPRVPIRLLSHRWKLWLVLLMMMFPMIGIIIFPTLPIYPFISFNIRRGWGWGAGRGWGWS
jgi:hypothetical protein